MQIYSIILNSLRMDFFKIVKFRGLFQNSSSLDFFKIVHAWAFFKCAISRTFFKLFNVHAQLKHLLKLYARIDFLILVKVVLTSPKSTAKDAKLFQS